VHARTRAGYLCTACLACTGVHVAAVGIGQGKALPCKHDASNSFATADQLLASACACRANAVAIAAAAAVDVSPSFRAGQTIAQDVVRWWEGLSSVQRTLFQGTTDPAHVLALLPSTLQQFLDGAASLGGSRPAAADRKAAERASPPAQGSPVSHADANERRERARASRLAFLGSLLSVLAVPSTRPGILDGLCRLHAMKKWRYETGTVLRTLGVHSRLPASERKRERRATLASPAAQMVETVARLFVDAGGRGAGATDNIDLEHSTAGRGFNYAAAKPSFHGTAAGVFVYRKKANAEPLKSTSSLSKGRRAPVASSGADGPLPTPGAIVSVNDEGAGTQMAGAGALTHPHSGAGPLQAAAVPKAGQDDVVTGTKAVAASSLLGPVDDDAMELDPPDDISTNKGPEAAAIAASRACMYLPPRSPPGLAWFEPSDVLVSAEERASSVVAGLRAERARGGSTQDALECMIATVAAMSDRGKCELVADVHAMPTSGLPATTNKGVAEGLDHMMQVLQAEDKPAQIAADQAVYVRIEKLKKEEPGKYENVIPYPGMASERVFFFVLYSAPKASAN
jgi:hypothetical protein